MMPPWKAHFWQRLGSHRLPRRAPHDRGPGSARLQHEAAVQSISLLTIHPCSRRWHISRHHRQRAPTQLKHPPRYSLQN